jgi:hypothetical protein
MKKTPKYKLDTLSTQYLNYSGGSTRLGSIAIIFKISPELGKIFLIDELFSLMLKIYLSLGKEPLQKLLYKIIYE